MGGKQCPSLFRYIWNFLFYRIPAIAIAPWWNFSLYFFFDFTFLFILVRTVECNEPRSRKDYLSQIQPSHSKSISYHVCRNTNTSSVFQKTWEKNSNGRNGLWIVSWQYCLRMRKLWEPSKVEKVAGDRRKPSKYDNIIQSQQDRKICHYLAQKYKLLCCILNISASKSNWEKM